MPDKRRHRGPHPEDGALFAPEKTITLRQAVSDYSWLLTRGYAENSALKLVGDKYQLQARQRNAVQRAACSDQALARRKSAERDPGSCAGEPLLIDGYNLLISLESALSGGVILVCRDGCYRDLAALHGTYRTVEETLPAFHLVGKGLAALNVGPVQWLFDAPVSNSGRLKALVLDLAQREGWPWDAELASDVDPMLSRSEQTVASSDSWVLDRVGRWTNLTRHLIDQYVLQAWKVELSRSDAGL